MMPVGRSTKGTFPTHFMDGQLSDRPLAELISEIMRARLSGALRLARERVRAAVYFEDGAVVSAATNLRALRLAEFARRAGRVEPGLLTEIEAERLSDERAGAKLIGAGALTPGELEEIMTAQTGAVLREALGWDAGAWDFDPRVRFAGGGRARPNVERLLAERGRAAPDETVARAFGESETLAPTEAAAGAEGPARIALTPAEAFVLSRVSGPMTLAELLVVGGLAEAETRRAVYVLTLCGLLERPTAARLFTPEAVRQARPLHSEQTAASPAGAAAPPAGAAGEERAAGQAQAPPPAAETNDTRAAMEELLELGRKATHYEVLGVGLAAGASDVKRAYHALAKRLHPDRFRREADGPLIQRLDASFARVTQAYEVLKDTALRASYDRKLSAMQKRGAAPASAAPRDVGGARGGAGEEGRGAAPGEEAAARSQAEEKFRLGLAALEKGDDATARRLLGEAALLAPREARYRAYYGRALARDRGSRRQAESEYKAALALDERNASYHVMLAELYQEIGLRQRAEGELRRALALEPGHDAARRLLERLGGAK
jgi:curved DNA-binding protein CbpA